MQTNKPDITIKDHKEKTCKLTNFTFPVNINISELVNYQNIKIFRLR